MSLEVEDDLLPFPSPAPREVDDVPSAAPADETAVELAAPPDDGDANKALRWESLLVASREAFAYVSLHVQTFRLSTRLVA
jgi:hypothetical protein